MTPRHAKTSARAWPDVTFGDGGPPLTAADLEALPVALTPGHREFLLRQNGGVPEPAEFVYPFEGPETVAGVDSFYAVGTEPGGYPVGELIADGFLRFRNHLPRWAVPLGRVDEDSFLVTFEGGPLGPTYNRFGEPTATAVWYFIHQHDWHQDGPHVEIDGAVAKLADSIPEFLGMLRPGVSFHAVTSYPVPDGTSNLAVRQALEAVGVNWVSGRRGQAWRFGQWDRFDDLTLLATELWLAPNDDVPETHTADIALPTLPDTGSGRVLHLLCSAKHRETIAAELPDAVGDWQLTPFDPPA